MKIIDVGGARDVADCKSSGGVQRVGDVAFTERRKTNSLYDVLVGEDEFKKTVLSVDPFVSEERPCGES